MNYTNSPLAKTSVGFGKKNSNARKDSKYNPSGAILKITPHHMAGVMSAYNCAKMHYNSSGSSANYYIGKDGEIELGVPESRRAWTSGSRENDYLAVTIEVSNSKTGGDWPVSNASFESLVNLCVDICKRNGIKEMNYTGDDKGNLTRHNMFQATTCPGAYLQKKFPELAERVNKALKGDDKPLEEEAKKSKFPYTVRVTASVLNVRKGPGTNYGIATTVKKNEIYTIVDEVMNGTTVWGKLKSGIGYISLQYTNKV